MGDKLFDNDLSKARPDGFTHSRELAAPTTADPQPEPPKEGSFQLGLAHYPYRYASDRADWGPSYVKDGFAYRCRGFGDKLAGAAAAGAARALLYDERQKAGGTIPSANDPELVELTNDSIAAACHHSPDEEEAPIWRDLRIRGQQGGSPYFKSKPHK